MKNKEIRNIKKIIMKVLKNNALVLKETAINVNYIINDNIKDKKIIEHNLDILLDLTHTMGDKTSIIYYKLLNFYKDIDVEASIYYKELYLDIINNQNPKDNELILKKKKIM